MLLSLVPIIAFIVSIVITLYQPKVRLGKREHTLDYGLAPLAGLVILVLASALSWGDVLDALRGNDNIRPYEIIILFMSLAYVCIYIDLTGFFKYISLKVAHAAGSDGRRLFLYFFFLSSALTMFTSNDIVILTLTPIICYFALYTGVDAVPFLVAQFFAANIWSMGLYIGNPTNIIVADAHNLTFLGYSAWMLLPTLVAGMLCLALLFIVFRDRIPKRISFPDVHPGSALTDRAGAYFGVSCLCVCLLLLSLAPVLSLNMSMITLCFAAVLFARAAATDIFSKGRKESVVVESMKRMPRRIVPFVIGMFIIVHQIFSAGWGREISSWLSQAFGSLASSVFGMGFLSAAASNLMNNQPMTIFFTSIIQDSGFLLGEAARKGAMFALVIGSNLGANITLIGALAGIMWHHLLLSKGIRIGFWEFFRYGLLITPAVILICCLTLYIELRLFG